MLGIVFVFTYHPSFMSITPLCNVSTCLWLCSMYVHLLIILCTRNCVLVFCKGIFTLFATCRIKMLNTLFCFIDVLNFICVGFIYAVLLCHHAVAMSACACVCPCSSLRSRDVRNRFFLFRFGFCKKTRIRLGMSLVWFG